MALDFSALPGKLADYALQENAQILTRLLVDDLSFTEFMTLMLGNDEIPLTELVVGDILQPGGKDDFNPTNNALKFKARVGKVRPCKVDLTFKPTEILKFWKTYLGLIAKAKPESPYDLPFEAFIMQEVIKKLKNNLRLKAVFKGTYNAAGTAPQDTMDGLETLVKKDITANAIPDANMIVNAPVTMTNALDTFESLAQRVIANPDVAGYNMIALCSPTLEYYYNQDYKNTHGALPYNTQFQKRVIDGTNIEILPEPGMSGSNGIIITPAENLFWLVDNEERIDSIIVEKALRNINLMMDFQAAVEYGISELIFTNLKPAA